MTPDTFLAKAPVHPDSLADYRVWGELLRKWNSRINLVAPNSVGEFWSRHALDSAQILPHIPADAETIVDFGSGAGFPALAIAIETKHQTTRRKVHLIESAGKKASFLKTVSRETSLNTAVHNDRIEKLAPLNADVITARAFAPLTRLLPLAMFHVKQSGRIVLLKGENIQAELDEVEPHWSFTAEHCPSRTSEGGSILILTELCPK